MRSTRETPGGGGRPTQARRRAGLSVVLGLVLALSPGCGAQDGGRAGTGASPTVHAAPDGLLLDLDFENDATDRDGVVATVPNAGSAEIRSSVTTSAGG